MELVVPDVFVFLLELVVVYVGVVVRVVSMRAGLYSAPNPVFFTVPGTVVNADRVEDVEGVLTRVQIGGSNCDQSKLKLCLFTGETRATRSSPARKVQLIYLVPTGNYAGVQQTKPSQFPSNPSRGSATERE